MTRRNKIIYWIATVWLALGMFSTGMVQILQLKEEVEMTSRLGYPPYLLTIIGCWKILGVIVIFLPRTPLLKEWAYAGFFFVMTGAAFSHLAAGTVSEIFPSLLLLTLTIVSWYFRPAEKKLIPIKA